MRNSLVFCVIWLYINCCFAQDSLTQMAQNLENILKQAVQETKELQKHCDELNQINIELQKKLKEAQETKDVDARGWTFASLRSDYPQQVIILSLLGKEQKHPGWYGYKDDLSLYVPGKGYIDFSAQGFFTAPDDYSTAYWWTKITYGEQAWTMKWNGDGAIHLVISSGGEVSITSAAKKTEVFSGDVVPKNRPYRYDKWRYPDKFYQGKSNEILSRIQETKAIVLEGQSTAFTEENWSYYRNNNKGYPKNQEDALVLTPDEVFSASAVAWFKKPLSLPYTIEFEYSVWDNDGFGHYNSADGIVLMFAKNAENYPVPPTGSTCGFVNDGTGYGVFLKTYGSRSLELRGNKLQVLRSIWYGKAYTAGRWNRMKVTVSKSGVMVSSGNNVLLQWQGKVDDTYKNIGFGAGTGGADSEHKIRNVKITVE